MTEEYSARLRQLIEGAKTRRLQQFRQDFDGTFSAELREILGVSYDLSSNVPVATFRAGDESWTITPGHDDGLWLLFEGDSDEDPDVIENDDDLLLLLDEAFPDGKR
jgi:hypothetical protein